MTFFMGLQLSFVDHKINLFQELFPFRSLLARNMFSERAALLKNKTISFDR